MVLHIGAPKSGTTHLQSRLHRNHAALLAHDVLVPRAARVDGPASLAFRAALDLTEIRMGRPRDYTEGRWEQLVGLCRAHPGLSVVSDEALVRADDARAARAVVELGAGDEVHVVYTARDLARQLVSGWLENLSHGGSERFGRYLARARSGELGALRTYDLPAVLGRWRDAVVAAGGSAATVHLVTVPPEGGDRRLLWSRFCAASGLDPTWAPAAPSRSNDAVGLPEAQFLRELNEGLGAHARRGGPLHHELRRVVTQGLAPRAGDSPRVRLDPRYAGWVDELTDEWLHGVRESDVDIVGDLDDLRARREEPADWVDPDIPVPACLEAADAALAVVRGRRRVL